MNLSELKSFVEIARAGSFSEASHLSGTPKSTLSKHIQMLEAGLKLRLIERNTRGLRLTPDGEMLFERATTLLADADDLRNVMQDRHLDPVGPLRVSAPVMFGQEFLGQIAAMYVEKWPKSSINVQLTDRLVDLFEENFDCAIRVGELKDSDLIARRLFHTRTILVAASHLSAKTKFLTHPTDLLDIETISFASNGKSSSWNLEFEEQVISIMPPSRISLSSLHSVKNAAIKGGGVALLPELLVRRALNDGELERVLENWTGPSVPISIVYPPHRHASARIRALIDLLSENTFN